MNELLMLHQVKPDQLLRAVLEKNAPLAISYFASGRWHRARVLLVELRPDSFDVRLSPRKTNQPSLMLAEQRVGISFKYDYADDTFICETQVLAVKSCSKGRADDLVVLAMPEQFEVVPRSSYLPAKVPSSLQVDVQLHRRSLREGSGSVPVAEVYHGWQGKLLNISAASLQVAIDLSEGPDLEKGQFVALRFTPMPHETPVMFNAYVRQILPADERTIRVKLEMVGLEASCEGRMVLQRLCSIVDQYRRLNNAACAESATAS